MTWMQLNLLLLVISLTGMGICAKLEQIAFELKMQKINERPWPFPAFPNPKDNGNKPPKFNPDNHEDAPV
jgi:hypothetical protein